MGSYRIKQNRGRNFVDMKLTEYYQRCIHSIFLGHKIYVALPVIVVGIEVAALW